MGENMIEIKNISKTFDKQILNGFSFQFRQPETFCFFGPSGCGKTTLMNLIAGLIQPDEGSITGLEDKQISYVFQEDRLLPWISARQNILAVNDDEGLCDYLLQTAGLFEDSFKFPNEMSGGMRQRISILRALAFDGDVFLMDEPFKGLDKKNKNNIIQLIKKQTQGKYCFLITHDKEEANALSDVLLSVSGPPFKVNKIITKSKVELNED